MEGDSRPVDFNRIWTDTICRFNNPSEPSLSRDEIIENINNAVNAAKVDKRFASTDPGFDTGFQHFLSGDIVKFGTEQAEIVHRHWEKFRLGSNYKFIKKI